MCDPVTLALAAGGLVLDRMSAANVARKEDRATSAELRRQSDLEEEARQQVRRTMESFDPERRDDRKERLGTEIEALYLAPLQDPDALTLAPGKMAGGNVSQDYLTALAGEEAEAVRRTAELAKLMSRIDASGRQRFEEGVDLSRSSQELGAIGKNANQSARVGELELNAASQANPLLSTLAGIAQGAAAAGVGSKTFGGGGPAPVPQQLEHGPVGRPRVVHVKPLR